MGNVSFHPLILKMVNILCDFLNELATTVFPNLADIEDFSRFATANFPTDTIFQVQCFRFGNLTGVNADCLKLS